MLTPTSKSLFSVLDSMTRKSVLDECLDGHFSVQEIVLYSANPQPTTPDSPPKGATSSVQELRTFVWPGCRRQHDAANRKIPAKGRGYASSRSGFSSFQTSVLSPLAIFSMLSIETFRSHRSTELT
jgi:hypothetical protein